MKFTCFCWFVCTFHHHADPAILTHDMTEFFYFSLPPSNFFSSTLFAPKHALTSYWLRFFCVVILWVMQTTEATRCTREIERRKVILRTPNVGVNAKFIFKIIENLASQWKFFFYKIELDNFNFFLKYIY